MSQVAREPQLWPVWLTVSISSAEEGGEAQKDFKDAVFTFAKDKLKVAVDKDVLEYTYKVDEGKTPKTIELRDPTEPIGSARR